MSELSQPTDSTPPQALEPLQVDVIEAARLLRYSRAKVYEMLSRGDCHRLAMAHRGVSP